MQNTEIYRTCMAETISGVYLITTDGPGGRFGLTVSSLQSLCLDPPTLQISIQHKSPALQAILVNGVFAVNTLGQGDTPIADVFAGRPKNGPSFDFSCANWLNGNLGCALLETALIHFECKVIENFPVHDHQVIIGSVENCIKCEAQDQAIRRSPLTYARGRYGYFSPITGPDTNPHHKFKENNNNDQNSRRIPR